MGWADKIEFYSNNFNALKKREQYIVKNWRAITWEECGKNILKSLRNFMTEHGSELLKRRAIWFDLSLSYGVWRSNISGIIRTELILAYHLKRIVPRINFFAFHDREFYIIPDDRLIWLFNSADVDAGYTEFQRFWAQAEQQGIGHRIPIYAKNDAPLPSPPTQIPALLHIEPSSMSSLMRIKKAAAYAVSVLPDFMQKWITQRIKMISEAAQSSCDVKNGTSSKQLDLSDELRQELNGAAQKLPFKQNDLVFSAGLSWNPNPLFEIIKAKRISPFYYYQLIYDLTPLNTPHLHVPVAHGWYKRFVFLANIASDKIIYGGKTAMLDGQKWQRDHNWPVAPGIPLKFGANLVVKIDYSQDRTILRQMGVTGPFILAVGTFEIRKNHVTLYRAYLKLLENSKSNIPQRVFVGGAGWNAQDIFNTISHDKRVTGKIIMLRTTDQQLDVLYRHCLFTLLASLYEGWSLTLPESLGYGKFCLTSDVPPLREVGRDLVDYIHPWDVVGWADKMNFYINNPKELRKRERRILTEWKPITWEDCAKQLAAYFEEIPNAVYSEN
jgi:glycosyltransferase involved in cell wall biosynthesis